MSVGRYPLGNVVRVAGTFRDRLGAKVDPTAVVVQVKNPEGSVSTPGVTRESLGAYYSDISADRVGTWEYRWSSTGTGQAADEDSFVVEHTEFPT